MSERLLKAEEVALLVGISIPTLNSWYRFKREYPDSEYAKMIPQYRQTTQLQKRYWTENDVYKLIEFKSSIPQGRNGVMGKVTQRYVKKKGHKNGKKKSGSTISKKSGK